MYIEGLFPLNLQLKENSLKWSRKRNNGSVRNKEKKSNHSRKRNDGSTNRAVLQEYNTIHFM